MSTTVNIQNLTEFYGETIERVYIYMEKNVVEVLKDIPTKKMDKIIRLLQLKDTIYKYIYDSDHDETNIYMNQFYLDNPSLFDKNGQPKV